MLLATCYLLLATFLSGCSDNRYLSEKLFWQAEREAASIYRKGAKNLTDADYETIIKLYKKVVDNAPLEPMAAKAQFAIAGVYTSQGKYKEAQKEFLEIINNFSSKPVVASEAQLAIGKLYEAQGKWRMALEEYDKIIDLYPLTPLGLNMPAYIVSYYENKNDNEGAGKAYERGVRHYNKIMGEFTETDVVPTIQDYLASFYSLHGDFKEAVKVWSQIIDNSPGSQYAEKAFLSKAETYAQSLKDIPSAIATFEEFIKNHPRYKNLKEIKMRIAALYFENSQIEQAKEKYSELLKDYPGDKDAAVKAYVGLSYCYRKEANTDKVIEMYNKIKASYPESQAALSVPFLIAQYYDELKYASQAGDAYKNAIVEYQKILEDDKRKEDAKQEAANFLALCYIKTKEMDKALQLLRMLSDKHQDNPTYLFDMATLYINLNAPDKAIKVYEEVIKKFKDNKMVVRIAQTQLNSLKAVNKAAATQATQQ